MITGLARILLGYQWGPFRFKKNRGCLPDLNVPRFGLYIHIPFCLDLCPFCPYYKVKYSRESAEEYVGALLTEIDLVGAAIGTGRSRKTVTDLYWGGGSPALLIDDFSLIKRTIDKHFMVQGNVGIELHPRDIKDDTADKLSDCGIDMICIGVQSFQRDLLANLGRVDIEENALADFISSNKFKAVDIDLIFGIPGQTGADLRADFLQAVEMGATQISTYPFIDFSYADNKQKPQRSRQQKELLSVLLDAAAEKGFIRTSVWTFAKAGTPRYSSVTRDNYLGFGPSAATLGINAFTVNTFSVRAYVDAVNNGIIPTALKMDFTPRTRKLYWLFWNCYNGRLVEKVYNKLFSADLERDFSFWLKSAQRLKLLVKTKFGWQMTEKGSYYFHRLEQKYTHQYIDKTWRLSMGDPWPDDIFLF